MIRYLLSAALFFILCNCPAQSTYTANNFASAGDTFYLTKANISNFNFDTTGNNITWNYSSLTGNSQRRLLFRLPNQTGYTTFQWPYINNSNNVNLSSTDEQTTALLGFQQTNPNDYYLKNNNYLRQKASSYTIVINGSSLNIKNVYTNPDTLYSFPFTNNSTNVSQGAYNISVPGFYYRDVKLNRMDTVKGWGAVTTPFGSFANCLKYVSTVTQIDSLSVNGSPVITNDTTVYREIKWFDPSKKYPVLYVRQNLLNGIFITQTIEYLDDQQFYQPIAFFGYIPVSPNTGDTVNFQNLSSNGSTYKWRFSDPASGAADSSSVINPQHIFNAPGTYPVKLIAINGPLTDSFMLNVIVNPVNTTYTFNGNGNWSNAANWSNNTIPPATLPSSNNIVIDHATGGQCILDVTQRVLQGASLTVNNGKTILIPGLLSISN